MPSKPPKRVPFHSYETMHKYEKGYYRIPPYLLDHEKFLNLSSSATRLYIYMRKWAKGRPAIRYAASMAEHFNMNPKTFRSARNELVEKGYLEYLNPHTAKDKKEAGEYQFSDRWWTGKTPPTVRADDIFWES